MRNVLHGPRIAVTPGFKKQEFIDELNNKGCYVHIVTGGRDKTEWCLNKMAERAIPTPATYAGTAPFALYDKIAQWKECSGIVFEPDSASVLSHKHDFWSNRLSHCTKKASDFKRNRIGIALDKEESLQKYADYLIKTFNALNKPTKSNFYLDKSKVLKLKADMEFSRAKYDEMKVRALSDQWPASVKENSSKYVINDLLKKRSIDMQSLDKTGLIAELKNMIREDPILKPVLAHPVLKINKFDKVRLSSYLLKVKDPILKQSKENFYSKYFRENRTLGPNEHLILPEADQICGVYVNTSSQAGIDSADRIHKALKIRYAGTPKVKYFYAILYQPLASPDRPIYMAGWAKAIQPWTTLGLIQFAKTGKITPEKGNPFHPNHFELHKLIVQGASTERFPDDLSKVKSGRNNLLHLAVMSRRSSDVLKFLLLWKVSPHEKGEDGLSAEELSLSYRTKSLPTTLTTTRSHTSLNCSQKQFILEKPEGVK